MVVRFDNSYLFFRRSTVGALDLGVGFWSWYILLLAVVGGSLRSLGWFVISKS